MDLLYQLPLIPGADDSSRLIGAHREVLSPRMALPDLGMAPWNCKDSLNPKQLVRPRSEAPELQLRPFALTQLVFPKHSCLAGHWSPGAPSLSTSCVETNRFHEHPGPDLS